MCVVFTFPTGNLRTPRRRGVGAERGSRGSQMALNTHYERMRTAEHAPPDPFRVLERRLDLAEIGERGGGVVVEILRVKRILFERLSMFFSVRTRVGVLEDVCG